MTSEWVAFTSLVLAGIVTLWTAIFQPIVNRRIEQNRRKEARKDTTMGRIQADSTAVLGYLAFFSSGDPKLAGSAEPEAVHGGLLTRFYTWELTVWPHLTEQGRGDVKDLRHQIEKTKYHSPSERVRLNLGIDPQEIAYPDLPELAPKIAQDVLELSETAIEAVP